MKKLCWILMLATTLTAAVHARDVGKYNVEELTDEDGDSRKRPFTITNIEQLRGELRVWIQAQYGGIAGVAKLVSSGSLEAQVSDGEGSSAAPLSLYKAVTCKENETYSTYHLGYSEPEPNCAIEAIQYYLRAPVTIGREQDFGIGLDPDFLWMIEEK